MEEQFASIHRLAKESGIPWQLIRDWTDRQRGSLPYIAVGRNRYIDRDEFMAYVQREKVRC